MLWSSCYLPPLQNSTQIVCLGKHMQSIAITLHAYIFQPSPSYTGRLAIREQEQIVSYIIKRTLNMTIFIVANILAFFPLVSTTF